jgi:hypothetical protein
VLAQDRPRKGALARRRVGTRARRTALGTVRAAASVIGAAASASELHRTHASPWSLAISTTIAASVASIVAAMSRFIGRAVVVTRP